MQKTREPVFTDCKETTASTKSLPAETPRRQLRAEGKPPGGRVSVPTAAPWKKGCTSHGQPEQGMPVRDSVAAKCRTTYAACRCQSLTGGRTEQAGSGTLATVCNASRKAVSQRGGLSLCRRLSARESRRRSLRFTGKRKRGFGSVSREGATQR